nr:trna-dihydrouridine(20a/20b) synthase [nad(p)+] [Quercus suber]
MHNPSESGASTYGDADQWDKGNDGMETKPRILELLDIARSRCRPLHISAPMVRYSKLPFRLLLRDYNVDVTYTPMILAHEFIRSHIARDSDFTTSLMERSPTTDGNGHVLIAQFASSDPEEFARATEMISPWVDGVNLNCGCPQSWAIKEGIGCSLMEDPELVANMVRAAKSRLHRTQSVSVKIRIHKDLAQTARWIKIVESAGVDYITIHARLRSQRSSTPPNYAAIRSLKLGIKVPVFANGDAYSMADVRDITAQTDADGIMAARGLLENPAMFAGHDMAPVGCVQTFVQYAIRCPIPFPLVLHHVHEMSARYQDMTKKEKKRLMACQDLIDLIDFVEGKWGLGDVATCL